MSCRCALHPADATAAVPSPVLPAAAVGLTDQQHSEQMRTHGKHYAECAVLADLRRSRERRQMYHLLLNRETAVVLIIRGCFPT
jgi:hypothetical protein